MPTLYLDKYQELMSSSLEELRSTTDITQLTPGAKARAFLEIINKEIGTAYTTFSVDSLQCYLPYAEDKALDLIAELVGLKRRESTRNEIDENNYIQKFYVQDGTFGTINNGSSFTIPKGTQVYTRTVSSQDESIKYELIEDTICNAGESIVYAAVRAIEFGTVSNVGAGTLVSHNFELYDDYLNGTLYTTNIESIAYATDRESNANLRYRISNQAFSGEAANETAIRLAILSVPGVADTLIDEYAMGIGTAKVYIKGIVPVISESLLSAVQTAIDSTKALGTYIQAVSPSLVGIELSVVLNLYKQISSTEQTALKQKTRDMIYRYINSLDINESLDISLLEQAILNVDSNIKSIGIPNNKFEGLWIWKYSLAEDTRVRTTALNGYTARNFERIIIEYTELEDGLDPIRVRVG